MQIKGLGVPRSRYLERGAGELSRQAQKRLAWFDYYQAQGRNAALTCRYFGIGRQTFYRWKRRYDPPNLSTLEDRSHQPHHRRHPTWTAEQAKRVRGLRERYPRWGKDKLAGRLGREGWSVAVSLVGRILTFLRQRGALRCCFAGSGGALRRGVPGPGANPRITRWRSPATWSSSIPWTGGPRQAWSCSSLRRGTCSRAGT